MRKQSGIERWQPQMLSVFRFVAGFMFLQHGAQKLFGVLGDRPAAELWTQAWVGGAIEFVAGILIMVGLLTRPAAFLASGTMAVAYFQFHAMTHPWPASFWPVMNAGVSAVLYCFIFLYLVFAGPGPWSADRLIWGRRG
jgi:putative oxidoreductase